MGDIATGRTAAQRVWLIDELVRIILAHLPSVGCTKTLASCACVSSAISEPALDMLWSRMTDLLPLCKLLPSDAEHHTSVSDSIQIPHTVIADDDWSRFTRYARRVRKLHYHCREGPSERVRQRTFAALVRKAARAGAPLLPRLEELSWLQFSQDAAHYRHFISPSLRRITVYVQTEPSATPSIAGFLPENDELHTTDLLRLLDTQSPEVEELSLEGIELPISLEPLLAFKRLRSLHLGSVASPVATVLSYCSAMPNLSSLSVDLMHCLPNLAFAGEQGAFLRDAPILRALEHLRVAGRPTSIGELLGAVHSPALRSISLSLSIPEHDRDGGVRCLDLLGGRFATSLEVVRVRYVRSAERFPSHTRPFAHYIQPLLPLRYLRECSINSEDPAPTTMTDADVSAMAEAWPALRSLDVTLRWSSSVALPSIVALEAFARHCPELVSLRLPLAQSVAVLDGWRREALPRRPHGLRSVWLSEVWFGKDESRRVVEFLKATFPRASLLPMLGAGVLRGSTL